MYIYNIHSDDDDETKKQFANYPYPYTTAFQAGRILLFAVDKQKKMIYNFEADIENDAQSRRLKQSLKYFHNPSLKKQRKKIEIKKKVFFHHKKVFIHIVHQS